SVAGGSPAAGYFILLVQNKVTKQKDALPRRPCGVPYVPRQAGRLRNSRFALKQCSPTSPGLAAVLGGSEGEMTPEIVVK
ncbi:MAG: hypothetical protein ACRD9S_25825, partial [Pyrinomonadaceae bacterium]